MSTLRNPIALATTMVALLASGTSLADEEKKVEPQQQPGTVTVVPNPNSSTTITSSPYAPAPEGGDRVTEKSVDQRPNRALLSTGATMFVLGYGASAAAGVLSPRPSDQNLFIPVAGPWMDLANRDCGPRGCGEGEMLNKGLLITSGVVQGAGVLLALSSFIIPESTTVEEKTSAKVKVLPVSFGSGGVGIGAIGRF